MHPKVLAIIVVFLYAGVSAQAAEPVIFDSRRPIALSSDEKHPRDFYINAGTEVGLKKGMVVNVTRRRSLYDTFQNRSPGDLVIPVGQVEIIHSQVGLSVARQNKLYNRKELPILDFDFIMVGDRLDLSSAKMSGKKTASKKLVPKPATASAKESGVVEQASSLPPKPQMAKKVELPEQPAITAPQLQ